MWRAVLLVAVVAGCLPADPADFRRDAGVRAKPQKARAAASRSAATRPATLPPVRSDPTRRSSAALLTSEFSDDFERQELGADWHATSGVWRIESGRLCGQGARNHPVWLERRLPRNASIEFQATSGSPNGDIKAEAWGDGASAAKGASYDDATSYIAILGGWKNSLHVLARLQEHASNRLELRLVPGSEDPRLLPVSEGRSYRIAIERSDGHTVRFSVDDALIHAMDDREPLFGPGHEYFAFNDWDVPVCFDDVVVTPLDG